MNLLVKLYDKKISSKGLAIFRIFFSLVFLFEIIRIFRYRELYYDSIPFIIQSPLSSEIPYLIWIFVLCMLIIGAFTRVMAIINYIFILVYIVPLPSFEYHMNYIYTGISFLFMFLSISKSFSIDGLLKRIKNSNYNHLYKSDEKTSVLNYWLFIFLGIGLIYFDSVFLKFHSKSWMTGLGLWIPLSIPPFTISNNQWLLNQEIFMKFLGYLALIFEAVFIFVFWVKQLRLPLFIIGVGMHLGIFLVFPIPFFAFGVIAIYLLLIPVKFWECLFSKLKSKKPSLTLFYDKECPLCIRTTIILKYFDVFNKLDFKSVQNDAASYSVLKDYSNQTLLNSMYSINRKNKIYSGFATYKQAFKLVPIFFPIWLVLNLPGFYYLANKLYKFVAKNRVNERCTKDTCQPLIVSNIVKIDDIKIVHHLKVKDIKIISILFFIILTLLLQFNSHYNFHLNNGKVKSAHKLIKNASYKLLGIAKHGVFLDGHYNGFDKIFSLTYNGEYLPLFDAFGKPDDYLVGGVWANYGFRVNKQNKLSKLNEGLIRYSAFWAHKNNIDLSHAKFKIIKKEVISSYKWEKDFLHKNMLLPWEEVGTLTWNNSNAEVEFNIKVAEK